MLRTVAARRGRVAAARLARHSSVTPNVRPPVENWVIENRLLVAHRSSVVAELRSWYDDGSLYGELTQQDHALQAAHQAATAGYPETVVVAALLHDVGWKLSRDDPSAEQRAEKGETAAVRRPDENSVAEKLGILTVTGIPGASGAQLRAQHDVIGGCWLRMTGFDETVAHLTEGHVLAKRYLCYKEPDYALSEESQETLDFQGGPMTPLEAAIFERDPMFDTCIQMRRWDEEAKYPDLVVPDLESYFPLIERVITAMPSKPGERPGTYLRDGNTIIGLVAEQAS